MKKLENKTLNNQAEMDEMEVEILLPSGQEHSAATRMQARQRGRHRPAIGRVVRGRQVERPREPRRRSLQVQRVSRTQHRAF